MEHTADPGLHWSIKRSFVRYVARMEDGQVLGGHGLRMLDASTFLFPPAAEPGADANLLAFGGELRLQAHNGALALRIARPLVDLSGERASVIIENPEGAGAPMRIATFAARAQHGADTMTWHGTDVRLSVEAVSLFGGYYGEDEVFDDLVVVLPAP